MANGVTSEWEDIHVKLGNYAPRPYEKPQAEYTAEMMDKLDNYDPLAKKNLAELDELEDDLDAEFLEVYKKKRLEEIQKTAEKPHFGSMFEISREEYLTHVTNAPKESFVVLHLYQDYLEKCKLMNELMSRTANKYPLIKFVKIVATRCIEGFPDSKLPCIIVYKEGKMMSNITNVDIEMKMTLFGLETFLAKIKVIEKEEDQEEEEIEKIRQISKGKSKPKREDDDSDSDNGKEYTGGNYRL